ncbi:MAG: ABC transporter ATP-binding protein [Acidobacteriota bacterium]
MSSEPRTTSRWGLFGRRTRHVLAQTRHLPRAWTEIRHATGGYTAAWLVLLAVQGLLPVAMVYLVRHLVDALAAFALPGSGASTGVTDAMAHLAPPALALGALLLGTEALRALGHWISGVQGERVADHLAERIQRQSARLDLEFYEHADFYDRLHRAREQARHQPAALLDSLGALAQNGLTLVAMAAVLLPYAWWLPPVLVLSTLPAVAAALGYHLDDHAWRRRTTADRRRAWYWDWLLSTRRTAAELRLLDLGGVFGGRFRTLRTRLRGGHLALIRRRALAELGAATFGFGAVAAVMVWMVHRLVRGLATFGDLALFYQAFHQGQRLMRGLLENVGDVYGRLFDLGDLFEFLDMDPRVVDPAEPTPMPEPIREGLALRGVVFGYPGSSSPVLDGLDLDLPAGQITAVVGANGAGKSTMVKLLCRLYDPWDGRVVLDGVDLRRLPLGDLRRGISVMFQEPVRYETTVEENIAVGDLANADRGRVAAAAEAAGATDAVEALDDRWDGLLGTYFEGGRDLSVGQWQRIALARAFLRRSPILILDEPTSAMDAWSEADWFRRFRTLAEGRLAVVITHRLTTARRADRIHVLDGGRLVESGSHEELLAAGGRYAESWHRQMAGDRG